MATSVTGSMAASLGLQVQETTDLSATFTGSPKLSFTKQFTTSDITKGYWKQYTVTTTPTSVDLTALTDWAGNALSFSTVKALLIVNRGTVTVTTGGGTNAVIPSQDVTAGGCRLLQSTVTVDGTHKIITLTAASGSATVDIELAGT